MDQYPTRPSIYTQAIIMSAAMETAKSTANIHAVHDLFTAIVACYSYDDNGYELARSIQDSGYSFDYDAMFVDAMDEMDCHVDDIHKMLCHAWVAKHDIQPPFHIGTLISKGQIKGICKHWPAYYLVKEDGCTDPGRHLLVMFENATLANGDKS